jgi:hypothetical protein
MKHNQEGLALAPVLLLLASLMVGAGVLAAEKAPPAAEGIVFGSLICSFEKADGTAVAPEDMHPISYTVKFASQGDGESKAHRFFRGMVGKLEKVLVKTSTKDGERLFVQRLPAGAYSISTIERYRFGSSALVFLWQSMPFTVEAGKSTYLGTLKLRHFGGAQESLEPEFVDAGARVIPMFKADSTGAAFEIQTQVISFTGGRLDFQQ